MVVIDEKSMLVSETDKRGVIRYVNDEFCRVSGYSESELLGKKHNIMHHQDMPPAVFKAMWETAKNGGIWKGFVKNMTKSGSEYWVFVTVFPIKSVNGEGYLAVRTRANEDEIARYEARYAAMLAEDAKQ
ncbi:MAG: PAS domain-containing protein [Helicobacteraceae bacterium]|jgi:aerotaxis receptor|nr:PAS domain-containing protein [Helicobacteraceae bacterium]